MFAIDVADRFLIVDRCHNTSTTFICSGIVGDRPMVNFAVSLELNGYWLAIRFARQSVKTARRIAAGAPLTGHVFKICVKNFSSALETDRNRVGRAPFIERV